MPAPDLNIYNPTGSRVFFDRQYCSGLAQQGIGSPGLSPGWGHNYDCKISSGNDGCWDTLSLSFPRGTVEYIPLTGYPMQAGQPYYGFCRTSGR